LNGDNELKQKNRPTKAEPKNTKDFGDNNAITKEQKQSMFG
jgi:hypothetical protein